MKESAENSEPEQKGKARPRGKPFAKGKSGNPGGRPKEAREVQELFLLKSSRMAELLEQAAEDGNVLAMKIIVEYGLGKPAQSVTVSGDVEKPLRVIFEKGREERK